MLGDTLTKGNIFTRNTTGKTIVYIPIKAIRTNPYQPRRVFNEQLLEELANSIKQYGVLQPISVRRLDDKNFELIAGERRLKACTMAGLNRIPAIICEFHNQDSAVVALIENIQRCDLTYMEEAEAYNKLLKDYGITQSQLAQKVGKTQSTIANKIRLLKLPQLVRDIIKDNDLTERHARALLRLEDADMQLEALNAVLEGELNVSDTDKLIDKMLMPSEGEPKPKRKPTRLKSISIFTKAISKTLLALKDKGINTESKEKEYDDYFEYSIKIYK